MWLFPVFGRSGKPEGNGVSWILKPGIASLNELVENVSPNKSQKDGGNPSTDKTIHPHHVGANGVSQSNGQLLKESEIIKEAKKINGYQKEASINSKTTKETFKQSETMHSQAKRQGINVVVVNEPSKLKEEEIKISVKRNQQKTNKKVVPQKAPPANQSQAAKLDAIKKKIQKQITDSLSIKNKRKTGH